eukprot:2337301-Amphidinium_carterae.1
MAVAPAQQGPMATASQKVQHMEDTPAYRTLKQHNLLTTEFRKQHFEDIFAAGIDLRANSSKENNLMERMKTC